MTKRNLPIPNSPAIITASKNVFSSRFNNPNSNSATKRGALVAKPEKKSYTNFAQYFFLTNF